MTFCLRSAVVAFFIMQGDSAHAEEGVVLGTSLKYVLVEGLGHNSISSVRFKTMLHVDREPPSFAPVNEEYYYVAERRGFEQQEKGEIEIENTNAVADTRQCPELGKTIASFPHSALSVAIEGLPFGKEPQAREPKLLPTDPGFVLVTIGSAFTADGSARAELTLRAYDGPVYAWVFKTEAVLTRCWKQATPAK